MTIATEISHEEELTTQFDISRASISTSFEVEPHFNIVVPYPEALRSGLSPVLTALCTFPGLAVTDIHNCHMTISILPDTLDAELIQSTVAQVLRDHPLNLELRGIHIRPPGIFLNVYSPDGSLKIIRQTLASAAEKPFDPDDRLANVG